MIHNNSQKNRPKNQPKNQQKNQIDKLIAFFKNLKVKKPTCDAPDYSSWNQTEAEYQAQQAEWLASVKEKKRK
jgi:hypothetical protein